MEEKWVNEQVAVEAELKKMADWKAHAERGLAELEAEKDDWEAKYDAMLSRNKELVKRTRDAEEMAEEAWNEVEEKAAEAASAVTILEPEDNLIRIQKERAIVKSPRRKVRAGRGAKDTRNEAMTLYCEITNSFLLVGLLLSVQ